MLSDACESNLPSLHGPRPRPVLLQVRLVCLNKDLELRSREDANYNCPVTRKSVIDFSVALCDFTIPMSQVMMPNSELEQSVAIQEDC
eukprot:3247619-Amphidinium_carterae.1